MKKIFIYSIVMMLSLVACGNSNGGIQGNSNPTVESIVGSKYGMEPNNIHTIEFKYGRKFVQQYNINGNGYEDLYKGDYIVNGNLIACHVTWVNTNIADQDQIGHTISFAIKDANRLQQSDIGKVVIWNKI